MDIIVILTLLLAGCDASSETETTAYKAPSEEVRSHAVQSLDRTLESMDKMIQDMEK